MEKRINRIIELLAQLKETRPVDDLLYIEECSDTIDECIEILNDLYDKSNVEEDQCYLC